MCIRDSGFFMELKEIIPGRSLVEPVCTMKRGNAPKQFKETEEIKSVARVKTITPDVADMDALDLDQFDENSFNDDDLEQGFDIMDMN